MPLTKAPQKRDDLAERLRSRSEEIEREVLNLVFAIGKPARAHDPAYVEGVRVAVSAAVNFGLAVVERPATLQPSIPHALLDQARLAARSGIGLDTMLRRYFAGHSLLGDFLVEEAEAAGLGSRALKELLRAQAGCFDHLIATLAEEHNRETARHLGSSGERRAELVERLLAGGLLDTSALAYELDGSHLGLVASGSGAAEAIRELIRPFDCRLLLVGRRDDAAWAWLGSRQPLDRGKLHRRLLAAWPAHVSLGVGEPAWGLAGWRFTHRQAAAALPVALRMSNAFVRYADVVLLASILQDDLLIASLQEMYLKPLEGHRGEGETFRETLRAYFAARCNVSSAAAALGVSRQAVTRRLRVIEERLGTTLAACGLELDAALRLEALRRSSPVME